jgi:hypothetical protein
MTLSKYSWQGISPLHIEDIFRQFVEEKPRTNSADNIGIHFGVFPIVAIILFDHNHWDVVRKQLSVDRLMGVVTQTVLKHQPHLSILMSSFPPSVLSYFGILTPARMPEKSLICIGPSFRQINHSSDDTVKKVRMFLFSLLLGRKISVFGTVNSELIAGYL